MTLDHAADLEDELAIISSVPSVAWRGSTPTKSGPHESLDPVLKRPNIWAGIGSINIQESKRRPQES